MVSTTPPVISEPDIWRAANLLIGQHGAGAASEATRRAGQMLDRADFDGWHEWARVRLAIDAMQAPRLSEPN
jgi:hypothetical protein